MKGTITRFARNHADKARRYVLNSLERQYIEASLSLETQMRLTKVCTLLTFQRAPINCAQDYVKDTVPDKVFTGYNKIHPSFKSWRHHAKALRADNRGRIDKEKRYSDEAATKRMERTCLIIRADRERNFLTAIVDEHRKLVAEAAKIPHVPRPAWVCPTGKTLPTREPARHPKVTYTRPEPARKLSYMEETRILYPLIEDPEERRLHQEKILASIISPERLALGLGTPSGHTGIENDPVLQQYYKERKEHDIWNAFNEWQANQLRQREEVQRRHDEPKAETERKRVLLEHFCSLYDQRVEKLAFLGPQMLATITATSQAIDSNNFEHFIHSVSGMNRILDAAAEIYTEMQREITLEQKGAQKLNESWPLEAFDQTFKNLEKVIPTLNADVQGPVGWMLQSIRNVCHPIVTAQPFSNPLANESSLPFVVQPIPISFEHFLATIRPQVAYQVPAPTYQASQFAHHAPQYQAP
jgi:hypothetical protein